MLWSANSAPRSRATRTAGLRCEVGRWDRTRRPILDQSILKDQCQDIKIQPRIDPPSFPLIGMVCAQIGVSHLNFGLFTRPAFFAAMSARNLSRALSYSVPQRRAVRVPVLHGAQVVDDGTKHRRPFEQLPASVKLCAMSVASPWFPRRRESRPEIYHPGDLDPVAVATRLRAQRPIPTVPIEPRGKRRGVTTPSGESICKQTGRRCWDGPDTGCTTTRSTRRAGT